MDRFLLSDIDYWIGLTDMGEEGTWIWEEKQTEAAYTNWHSGQPDNYNDVQDCVVKDFVPGLGQWYDDGCDKRNHGENKEGVHALCQKSK